MKSEIVGSIFFLVLGFLILFHQYLTFGKWFEVEEALHHEVFALMCFAFAFGILIGAELAKRK